MSIAAVASFGGAASGTLLEAFAYETVKSGGVADDTSVGSGAAQFVYAGGLASSTLIGPGREAFVLSDGTMQSASIQFGGFLSVSSGGASNMVVSAGGMELISAGAFVVSTTLLAGGAIDLDTVVFASGGSVTLGATTNTLSMTENGVVTQVSLAGSYQDMFFQLSVDADGSTIVTAERMSCLCRGTLIRTECGDVAVSETPMGRMHWLQQASLRVGSRSLCSVWSRPSVRQW